GKLRFPEITDTPYFISLGPYDFYWLAIALPQAEATEHPTLTAKGGWTALLEPKQRPALVRALVHYAQQRRWYRGKARTRKNAQLVEMITFPDQRYAIAQVAIEYERGQAETYVLPIAFAEDAEPGTPAQVIATVSLEVPGRGQITGVLYDALFDDGFDQMLLATMRAGGTAQLGGGSLARLLAQEEPLAAHATSVDQTNSGVIYGDRFLLKLFRVLDEGPNAELELGRFFAEHASGYRGVARLAGWLATGRGTLGTLFELVPNNGDAWQLTQDALDLYYDRLVSDDKRPEGPPLEALPLVQLAKTKPPDRAVDWVGPVLDRMRLLGTRTAELHRVLASSDDPLFAPEPYDIMHQQSIYGSAVAHAARTFDLLRAQRGKLPAELVRLADEALAREAELDRALAQVTHRRIDVVRTRLHGDFHLAQVLWTGDDFVIIDFEGEPGRPLSQRRFKRAALRDVAGMIRSLHYASAAALRNGKHRPEDRAILAPWSRAWSEWMSAAFLAGYLEVAQGSRVIPSKEADLQLLLDFFLLEKCVYEIGYELDNRPDWVEIPLRGLLALLPGPA
ncbi:MAG: putative maltokinase, partial [Kofleriaceae bacterium]